MVILWLYHLFFLVGKSFYHLLKKLLKQFAYQLAYEAYKAKKIIQSRDISYAFTNVMANHYYSLRELFLQITL